MYWLWDRGNKDKQKNILIMIDNNLILWLPFNDPDGSVAYDYSISRADATLSDGAKLTKIPTGKALSLNGGEALSSKVIPFSSNFTIYIVLQPNDSQLGWLLNFTGVNNYLEQWIDVTPGKFITLAFVRNGNRFTVYNNGLEIYSNTISGTPTGFSINDQSLYGSNAMIDEVRVYNVAKTLSEILEISKSNTKDDVEYYLDGVNFKEYGVYVSDSKGLAGRLARKEALTVDWDNYHGIVRDKKRPRFKERNIQLECFIEASSRYAYVDMVNRFFSAFDGEDTQRLKVEYAGITKPLVYEVVCLDEADPVKKWGRYNKGTMVGTFTMKLVEDEPVKRVLRHVGAAGSTSTITVTSNKLLNIHWGDGTHTYNVSGTQKTVQHTYADQGEYEIVITGIIEDIEEFSTNDIIIWENLH